MSKREKNLGTRALNVLASLRLSLSLFLALAATSVFGTVIQQQADSQAYIESYGPALAKVIQALGLVDMYHSWWFEVLLALLLANTLVCSLRRVPAALRSIRPGQFLTREELGQKKFCAAWAVRDGVDAAVTEGLSETFGRPRLVRNEGATLWFAQKQPWARLGAYVAHASLVLFFLGGIVGARYGFKGFVNIFEGQSMSTISLRSGGTLELPFEVGCEKFELQTYPDGRPKDYLSRLVVRKDGDPVQEKTIEVNDPLIQDGIFFYQSSYGKAGGGAVLKILDRNGRPLVNAVRIPEEKAVRIPGTDLSVEVVATSENFNGFGPSARLALVSEGQTGHAHVDKPFVVLQNFPDFDKRRSGNHVFQLVELLAGRSYTGLQVAKDPGVPFIWAGSVLLSLGTLMAFFSAHRRVWVSLEGGRLTVAGTAAKNQTAFRETFDELTRELRERTETAQKPRRAAG